MALFRVPGIGATNEQRRRDDQQQRRNLRIAIRQLERAELYMVALYSLNLGDGVAQSNLDDVIGRLRTLRQYLVERKQTA